MLEKITSEQLDLGDILHLSWLVVIRNFFTICLISLTTDLPIQFISLAVSQNVPDSRNATLIISLVAYIPNTLVYMSLAILVERSLYSEPPGFVEIISAAWPGLFKTVITNNIALAIVCTGLLLLIIPGIFLLVNYSFAIQAAALRHKYLIAALSYSSRLLKNNWWEVAAICFSLVILLLILHLVLVFPLGIAAVLVPFGQVITVLSGLVSSWLGYWFIICYTILFLNLDLRLKQQSI